jgi:PGF-CTERM protein
MKKGEVNLIDPMLIEKTSLAEIHADPTITAVLTAAFSWQGLFFNPKYVDTTGIHHLKKKGVRHGISHAIPREDIIENLLHGSGAPGYTPFAIQSWATIDPEDLLQYKKTVVATDGSRPEVMERTHFDSYNLSLALDWFETEGYDVQPYREALNRPSTPSFIPGFGIVIAFIACVGLAAFLSRKQH